MDPIVYEETPIIEPIEDPRLPDPLDTPELSSKSEHGKQSSSGIGKAFVFFILFVVGVVGSTVARPFLEGITFPTLPSFPQQKNNAVETPTPTGTPTDERVGWREYDIRAGDTIMVYRLPETVIAPVCDGPSCPSEGTYLPGGSRFTISSKTMNPPITDFTKLIVKDAGGRMFTTDSTSVAGLSAVSFSGTFTGFTTGGYTFTAMHGVMIQITPALAVEINHFAPNGIVTEFEKDDAVFSDILKTVRSVSTPSATVK